MRRIPDIAAWITTPLITPSPPGGERRRVEFLDIARAIAIIAVAWLHTNQAPRQFIHMFTMPMFFLISGMFLNPRRSPRQFLNSRIKGILYPLLLFVGIGFALEYFVFDMTGWEEFKDEPFDFVRIHNVTLWFFCVLIYISIFTYIIEHYIKPTVDRLAIYLGATAFGMLLVMADFRMPLFLSQTFLALPFFVTGYWLRNLILEGRLFTPLVLILSVIGMSYGVFYRVHTDIIHLKMNPHFFQSYLPALSLIAIIMFIAALIAEKIPQSRLKKGLIWIGESTLFVALIHRIPIYKIQDRLWDMRHVDNIDPMIVNSLSLIIAIAVVVGSVIAGKLLCRLLPWCFPSKRKHKRTASVSPAVTES